MSIRKLTLTVIAIVLILCCSACFAADSLAKGFQSPPDSARPWVYWFWLNGNITKSGITADLEAMKRVGIGGVLIMEVDQGAPVGPVDFMGDKWRELFKHVVSEAKRLGLEVNMNNDAGWNGSGGPWIKPEQSMQKVVWSEVEAEGSKRFDGTLPQPTAVAGFYQDIKVLAFPTVGSYRIPGIQTKAASWGGPNSPGSGGSSEGGVTPEMIINSDKIVDISDKMDSSGHLVWDVPAGKWTVVRFGHTSTGVNNSPAPATGRGLECDKLSKEGSEAAFNGMMAKLVADSGSAGKGALVATHVDSWENGSQNWTAKMREEFQQRRGYDMMPFLPVMTGRVVGSAETSDRFLWDLRRTISDLVVENYAGHIRDMAHQNGLRFTIEAYGSPCDNIPYGGMADEPMGEFWDPSGAMETCRGMASSGHVYGKPVIGAEAFTAGGHERWLHHPASLKALGDQAFCEGINRFVFHRYAMQPWTEPTRKPGMMMGPWGQHYERTETWWEQTPAWHKYLSRCQYMLRQGLFVADICYLQAENSPSGMGDHPRKGYNWDECGAEVVLTRMSVKNGRIVLPDGMSYRVLVLPESQTMTPALLRKISELVKAGATVIGPRPVRSPSLNGYPKCDEEVARLAQELWGDGDGKQIKEHRLGKGRVVWGIEPEKMLAQSGVQPDFAGSGDARYIHRRTPTGADIYFVSNPRPYETASVCTFRVSGKVPELWWPDSGRVECAAVYQAKAGVTTVMLPLGPSGSVFVVFRNADKSDPVVEIKYNGKSLYPSQSAKSAKIVIQKATYGILDDPARTRDVRDKAQKIIDGGEYSFRVSEMAAGDDPAFGTVKTLVLDYTIGGKKATATGTDPEIVDLALPPPSSPSPCVLTGSDKSLMLTARQPGRYSLVRASVNSREFTVSSLPPALKIGGPWKVSFPANQGAPGQIKLDRLISLSENVDAGVKYFSGTATYSTTFDAPKSLFAPSVSTTLNLGDVQVMAEVKLNGKPLGLLWKQPFIVDVTKALRPGMNVLEVKVTNQWVNRLIGDAQLPEDSDRNGNGTLKSWPQWLQDGRLSPTGRITFADWLLWRKDEPLLKSGLIGPVTITAAQEITVK